MTITQNRIAVNNLRIKQNIIEMIIFSIIAIVLIFTLYITL